MAKEKRIKIKCGNRHCRKQIRILLDRVQTCPFCNTQQKIGAVGLEEIIQHQKAGTLQTASVDSALSEEEAKNVALIYENFGKFTRCEPEAPTSGTPEATCVGNERSE